MGALIKSVDMDGGKEGGKEGGREGGAFIYRHEHYVGWFEWVLCWEEDAPVVDTIKVVTGRRPSQGEMPLK